MMMSDKSKALLFSERALNNAAFKGFVGPAAQELHSEQGRYIKLPRSTPV